MRFKSKIEKRYGEAGGEFLAVESNVRLVQLLEKVATTCLGCWRHYAYHCQVLLLMALLWDQGWLSPLYIFAWQFFDRKGGYTWAMKSSQLFHFFSGDKTAI